MASPSPKVGREGIQECTKNCIARFDDWLCIWMIRPNIVIGINFGLKSGFWILP
jgi:hypothetical protein